MTASPSIPSRLQPGEQLAPFRLETLSHGTIEVPSAGLLHLQFRRFAGCPICNLHLRTFTRDLPQLEAAKIRSVAFFHSNADELRDVPFPVVADPERTWYRRFAVEQSTFAAMHPAAMASAMRGLFLSGTHPLKAEGGTSGLPADFLIDPKGRVVAAHYGAHADDSWSVADVLKQR
ncbi:MAG TPA: peroxiredoxin-like family protein [Archangium sp.]